MHSIPGRSLARAGGGGGTEQRINETEKAGQQKAGTLGVLSNANICRLELTRKQSDATSWASTWRKLAAASDMGRHPPRPNAEYSRQDVQAMSTARCSEDDSGHDGSVQRLGKWAADRHAGLAHTPYETLDSCSDYTHTKVSAKGRMHAANTFGVLTDITRRGYPAESEAPTTCRWKHAIVRWVEEAGRADRYAQATLSELYWGVLTGRQKKEWPAPAGGLWTLASVVPGVCSGVGRWGE